MADHSAGQWRYLLVDSQGYLITTNLIRRRRRNGQRRDERYASRVELVLTPDVLDELRRAPHSSWTAVLREIADSIAADAQRPPPDPDRRYAGAWLRRRILARTPRCVWPGCTEPALGCQVDHARDHAKGGPTDEANQWPLCRHHHNLKTNHGWTTQITGPRTYELISPIGTTHAVVLAPTWAPLPDPWNHWRRLLRPFLDPAA